MIKGGYILIDCTGLDLIKGDTPQTITGIYAKVKSAMQKNKLLLAQNCVWDDIPTTPIPVLAIQIDSNTIVATANTLQIWITNEDVVTISNLVGD